MKDSYFVAYMKIFNKGMAVLVLFLFGYLALDMARAGEGLNNIVTRWMERGGMSPTEITRALKYPQKITINDEIVAILPDTVLYISDDGKSGYLFILPDTIFGEKLYPVNVKKKKKATIETDSGD